MNGVVIANKKDEREKIVTQQKPAFVVNNRKFCSKKTIIEWNFVVLFWCLLGAAANDTVMANEHMQMDV